MTKPDKLAVLRAAIRLWDTNERGVTSNDLAADLGVEEGIAKRELLPLIVEYFVTAQRGDDGVAVVREPTAAARRFVGR